MTKQWNQKGVALFFALIFVMILSVMGVSMMFLGKSETWSGLNYRMMTQARYGGEAGLNAAANYLINTYTAPDSTGTDLLSNYDLTKSPVQYNNGDVVLSTTTSQSNYPVDAVKTAFKNAAQGSLTSGTSTVNYTAKATLMAMSQVNTISGPVTIQKWSITANGNIGGVRSSQVEVTGIIERQVTFSVVSAPNFGAFGTGNQCGALKLSGGVLIASYDSKNATLAAGSPPTVVPDAYGGNIGSNGNLNESGSGSIVDGTMSTPLTGVGNCSNGSSAWTVNGNATVTGCSAAPPAACVTGGLVHLSQPVNYATPTIGVAPTDNLKIQGSDTCASAKIATGCTDVSAGNLILAPLSGGYGNITISGGAKVTFAPGGTYLINSISLSGNSKISTGTSNTTPVILNISGKNQSTPIDFTGGTVTNISSGGVPTPINLQIQYAGTGNVKLSGGSQTAAAVYAPNAPISLSGGSNFYGSLIGSTITDTGGTSIFYDRELGSTSSPTLVATVGNFMMDSFSWSRF
ncbi:MAG TPA: pilus assembly PilX N-terminal domain-containing protein [Candidatus Saccharimonadales bacterium]|nr:pilus assembly PilX N-terminal domain-containing protein [Candidatus Saccharimonadales bacterium]